MASLAPLGLIEVVGTSGADAITGRPGAVAFGREGGDVLSSDAAIAADQDDQLLFGGSGIDTYVVRAGTSVIIADRAGDPADVVRSSGIGFSLPSTFTAEIDGRHLAIFDTTSNTQVFILDWLVPGRRIERFDLADGEAVLGVDLSISDIRSSVRYLGDFGLDALRAEVDLPGPAPRLTREVIDAALARSAQLETAPQPEQIQITGTAGDDRLVGDGRANIIRGLSGDDEIIAGAGADLIEGGAGSDTVAGGSGADEIYGNGGADRLSGNAGDDRLFGGTGPDLLFGNSGDDLLSGNRGADTLDGGVGDDELYGGAGNDELRGRDGADRLFGQAGDDVLQGDAGSDLLNGGAGQDVLFGGDGDDRILGGDGNDQLFGEAGDDLMRGGPGNDMMLGGIGRDVMFGDTGNDRLNGGPDANQLFGGPGDDVLIGGSSGDRLKGDQGNDVLTGGLGRDRFVFANADDGIDRITDFAVGPAGDVLDIGEVLTGFAPGSEGDFLRLADDGADTTVQVDPNGGAGGSAYSDLAVLDGVSGVTLDTLIANDQIDFS